MYSKSTDPGNNIDASKNMHEFISNYCSPSDRPSLSFHTHRRLIDEYSALDQLFSLDELEIAINSLKKKSSPGLDKITNEMIFHTPNNYRE